MTDTAPVGVKYNPDVLSCLAKTYQMTRFSLLRMSQIDYWISSLKIYLLIQIPNS